MKLYELAINFKNLSQLEEVEGLTSEMIEEAMSQVEGDINLKIENTCKVIKNIESDTSAIDNEIYRLLEMKKQKEKTVKSLKNYIQMQMEVTGITKIESKLFKVATKKSKAVEILDEALLPKEFLKEKTTVAVDKIAIKKALSNGEVIEGAKIKENTSLNIK